MTVSWQDRPERNPDKRQGIKFLAPKPGETLQVQLLNRSVTGIAVHWCEQTVPCENTILCCHCQAGRPRRWKGYIAARYFTSLQGGVLEVTEGAFPTYERIAAAQGSLLGVCVAVWRPAGKPNNPVQVKEVDPPHVLRTKEVPEVNIRDWLHVLFKLRPPKDAA